MADLKPEIVEMSIVLIGSFDPAYMTPAWFAHHGLLGEDEANDADIQIAHPDFVNFAAGWVDILAERNRIQIKTSQAPLVRIKDFVTKLLSDVISSMPIIQFGINYSAHFQMNFAALEKLGERLAPREPWGEWGKNLHNDVAERANNGLLSISMRQGNSLDDRKDGQIIARVEVSKMFKQNQGVHVFVNDHYEIGDEKNIYDAVDALSLINKQYDISFSRSAKIAKDVIDGALK